MTLDDVSRVASADYQTWDQTHRRHSDRPEGVRTAVLLAAIDEFAARQPVGGTLTPTSLRDLLLRWEMERPA